MVRPNPPPPTAAADQTSLIETPICTILPDVIILAFETTKQSKPKSSKNPVIKPKPKAARISQRMKYGSSSKTPIVSHVDLGSDEEKEDYGEKEKIPEEEKEEDFEQTLY